MGKYKITVEEVIEPKQGERYTSEARLYEQIVTGDESIVNGVVQTVLTYNSHQAMQSFKVRPSPTQQKAKGMSNLKKDIDEIVFRCFAQGQYWGTEADGKLDPGYKPEKPIDRTQAVNNILNLIESVVDDMEYQETEDMSLKSWTPEDYKAFGRNELRAAIKSKLIDGEKK